MIFSYNTFLRPITQSDTNIQVFDNKGIVVYTINPFSIGTTRVSNNILEIAFRSGKIISISFSSQNEAKVALSLLQSHVDTLLTKTPTLIDVQIKNYIGSSNLTLNGNLVVNGQSTFTEVTKVINSTPSGATASIVTYDFSGGDIWYHGTASQNFTANFINIPTTNFRKITTTVVIAQGVTAYIPTTVKINGTASNVKWLGGTASGSSNKVDIIEFNFIYTNSGIPTQVLGQINPFS